MKLRNCAAIALLALANVSVAQAAGVPIAGQAASVPTYDVSAWTSGAVDPVGGVSPYVVVLANELVSHEKDRGCQPALVCGVTAVYRAHVAEHLGLNGGDAISGDTVAQLLGLPEPTSDQLAVATGQIQAAGLAVDSSDFWR